jgi:hypothetical protein
MKRQNRLLCTGRILVLSLGCCSQAGAMQTARVSDAQSQVQSGPLAMQWQSLSPGKNNHQVQGTTRVHIKLDTRAWMGQPGKIYMVLPPPTGNTIEAHWSAQNNTLLSGQVVSGQRSLVWSGVVPSALLEDVLTVTIQTDGRQLSSQQRLRFHFEIDTP